MIRDGPVHLQSLKYNAGFSQCETMARLLTSVRSELFYPFIINYVINLLDLVKGVLYEVLSGWFGGSRCHISSAVPVNLVSSVVAAALHSRRPKRIGLASGSRCMWKRLIVGATASKRTMENLIHGLKKSSSICFFYKADAPNICKC